MQGRVVGLRHCWVNALPGLPDSCPGLLAEWKADEGGHWFGRVVYAVDGDVALVEAWVPSKHLSPADG